MEIKNNKKKILKVIISVAAALLVLVGANILVLEQNKQQTGGFSKLNKETLVQMNRVYSVVDEATEIELGTDGQIVSLYDEVVDKKYEVGQNTLSKEEVADEVAEYIQHKEKKEERDTLNKSAISIIIGVTISILVYFYYHEEKEEWEK